MSIPEELHWVQRLIARRGVSGTVQLLEAWCRDAADRSAQRPQLAQQWAECANILADTVALVRPIEPQVMEEQNEGGS